MRRQAERRRVKKPSVISRGGVCWGLIHSPKATRAPGDSGQTRWVLMLMIHPRAMHKMAQEAGPMRKLLSGANSLLTGKNTGKPVHRSPLQPVVFVKSPVFT